MSKNLWTIWALVLVLEMYIVTNLASVTPRAKHGGVDNSRSAEPKLLELSINYQATKITQWLPKIPSTPLCNLSPSNQLFFA